MRKTIKRYENIAYTEPLFVEGIASLLTGVFLLIWSVLALSNDFFQLSLFVQARNSLLGPQAVTRRLSGISFLDIDPDALLVYEEHSTESASYYEMVDSALVLLGRWATTLPEGERIVVGLDLAFLSRPGDTSVLENLQDTFASLPPNLSVVVGFMLGRSSEGLEAIRSDILSELVRRAEDALEDNLISAGYLHYLSGHIRSGLGDGDGLRSAVAYHPYIREGQENDTRRYPSLPFAMFAAAHDGIDLRTEFYDGSARFEGEHPILLQPSGPRYIDFFTPLDISDIPQHFVSLSSIDPLVDPFALPLSIHPSSPAPNEDGVRYVFVGTSRTMEVIDGQRADIMTTAASTRDAVTGQLRHVSGIMAHITALSNLEQRRLLLPAGFIASLLLIIPTVAATAWVSLRFQLGRALLLVIAIAGAIVLLSFIVYLGGLLVILRVPLAAIAVVFTTISSLRYFYTVRRRTT